jgi:hypothetical protein
MMHFFILFTNPKKIMRPFFCSPSKVPVATLHAVEEVTPEDREESALAKFAEARKMVMDALTKLENFTDSNLEVVLFSGEGDSLHQVGALHAALFSLP